MCTFLSYENDGLLAGSLDPQLGSVPVILYYFANACMAPPPPPTYTRLPSLRVMYQHASASGDAVQAAPPLQRLPTDADVARGTKRKRGRPSKYADTHSAHAFCGDALQPTKPMRKYVYVAQKEERDQLLDEVQELEQRVESLRLQTGLPTKADRQRITQTLVSNAELDESVHTNRRFVTQLRSQLEAELMLPAVNPLASRVHLPVDMDKRRAILRSLKDVKLRRAAEVGIARFRHLMDGTASYLSEEQFTTDDGAFHRNRWEMLVFPQFATAKQLYDALLFFISNMEISVTEMVNQVAVREDNEEIEPTIWNHRMVSVTEDIGVTEELNLVGFAQFYERYDLLQGEPLGVIMIDSVQHDDLYPYQPAHRTRKDVQTFHLFCERVDPATQRKVVVLQTCLLNAQLPPQFAVASGVVDKLHAYMSRWVVLMNQYLSEYTVPP